MKQRKLGPRGPSVGEIGLGMMNLSIAGRPSEAEAIRTIQAALDAGVTLLDTADVYCLDDGDIGHSERLIAKALQPPRQDILVATKGGLRRPGGAWTRDARPQHLVQACEASLRALGVARIGLYQLHAPDSSVPFADSVGALARLRDAGKVELVGLSNVSSRQIEEALRIVPIASVQNRYSPMDRSAETDGVLAACERHGIAFLPYFPFGGRSGATRLGAQGRLGAEAARRQMSPHRLVLAWMLARSPVMIPIPGARRAESIRDSAAASSVQLSPQDLQAVEAAFPG